MKTDNAQRKLKTFLLHNISLPFILRSIFQK